MRSRRGLWVTGFLTVTAVAVGMELWAALDRSPDTVPWTSLVITYVPREVTMLGIAVLVGWLPAHFLAGYASKGGDTMATRAGLRWLKADAANRAWRTVLQGMAVAVLSAVGDAVVQVLQRAVAEGAASHRFEWHQVATTAMYAAGTAGLMAVAAYLHRLRLDPSPVPSAQPPAPPPQPPAPPATDPMPAEPVVPVVPPRR